MISLINLTLFTVSVYSTPLQRPPPSLPPPLLMAQVAAMAMPVYLPTVAEVQHVSGWAGGRAACL